MSFTDPGGILGLMGMGCQEGEKVERKSVSPDGGLQELPLQVENVPGGDPVDHGLPEGGLGTI